jgi:predicted RNase H-like HicB family nuclease
LHLKHPHIPGTITVPVHAGETIGPKLLANILRQAGMTVEELRRYLSPGRPKGTPMRHYTIILDYDPDVDAYAVTVPALPGCFTQGATVDEAIERAKEAIQGHLEVLAEDGEPIPDDSIDIRMLTVAVLEPAPVAS